MINEEIGEDGLPIMAGPTMEDAFNEMEKKKEEIRHGPAWQKSIDLFDFEEIPSHVADEIQQMRAKFMFPIQEQIREDERKRYEQWKAKD